MDLEVVGSNPTSHPERETDEVSLFCFGHKAFFLLKHMAFPHFVRRSDGHCQKNYICKITVNQLIVIDFSSLLNFFFANWEIVCTFAPAFETKSTCLKRRIGPVVQFG